MTQAEQSLADDRARAEIARLSAEVAKISAETAEINRRLAMNPGEASTLVAKLNAETLEIHQNMKYRMWVLGAAYLAALGVLLRLAGN